VRCAPSCVSASVRIHSSGHAALRLTHAGGLVSRSMVVDSRGFGSVVRARRRHHGRPPDCTGSRACAPCQGTCHAQCEHPASWCRRLPLPLSAGRVMVPRVREGTNHGS